MGCVDSNGSCSAPPIVFVPFAISPGLYSAGGGLIYSFTFSVIVIEGLIIGSPVVVGLRIVGAKGVVVGRCVVGDKSVVMGRRAVVVRGPVVV